MLWDDICEQDSTAKGEGSVTKIMRVNGLEYEISSDEGVLGQGGQGTVWRVVREGRQYAIKKNNSSFRQKA